MRTGRDIRAEIAAALPGYLRSFGRKGVDIAVVQRWVRSEFGAGSWVFISLAAEDCGAHRYEYTTSMPGMTGVRYAAPGM